MNGTTHAAIGAATGFIVASTFDSSPSSTLLLVGLGGVSGLIPDLDVDGKLRGKMTLSHKMIQTVAQLIGVLMIIYSFYEGVSTDRYVGIGIGLGMIILSSSIKQKHMLTITGIGVIAGGSSLQETWLMLFGIYILIASFVPHRSYTHSIVGVVFFGIIASHLERSLGINGIFYTCLIGYISHLITDSKLLPFNKRGVKLFLPISSKEI
ncbi:inner membrane protein [Virgibacillus natechei]|uniref:Inner membrane protein n=1 Tax=Virgibacillus natechei TaxID=1216297 RepID=A0ABS4IDQ3_9BACI|nr:metal-dependent hydrolase [Virgibacillus natechei]MBP1969072.1 inner membrane protein [Virgibacillus natechei]UZD14341.1 metal-dependent hydrolase [Virgibacillus natechei]